MKKSAVYLALTLLASTTVFADVKIEMDGKEYGCDKKSSEVFHCEYDGKKVLVVKNFMGYMAYEKKETELPSIKWLTKVTDGEKVLYEIPKINIPGGGGNSYPSGGMFGGMMGGFRNPDTKSLRLMNASGIVGNLKDVRDDWAKDFVGVSNKFIEDEKASKSKAKIVSKGKEYTCTRGEDKPLTKEEVQYQDLYNTNIQCNYFACIGPAGDKVLGFIPGPGTFQQPYFINLKGIDSELHTDDFKIYDNEKGIGIPTYDVPNIAAMTAAGGYGAGYKPEFDEKLLIPSKYDKNVNTFNFFTNPYSAAVREETLKQCSGENEVSKYLAEEKRIADMFQNDLATTELSHYLTMVNGQMLSLVVDATKGRGLGCRYDDMILSQKAQEHLSYLQKAHPKPVAKTISENEVQELFLKAKNMPDIPFGYKYDGCYARAHVMARRFEAMGIPTEKVWIKGSLYVPGTDVQWNYHVAPVINVKSKNGDIVKYVIDPSLTDKAVPVDDWVASMGKNVKGGVMKTSYPFPLNIANFQRTAVAISSSDIYVPDNDEVRSEEENMKMAIQTMKEYSQALKEKQNEKDNTVPSVI